MISAFPFLSDTAMILAAGFGKRMQPLTLETPKPLLKIGGKTMLDRALDALVAFGVKHVIVNGHYLADQIKQHLALRKDVEIFFSYESEILETGGGVRNVRDRLGEKPFFLLGGDMPWMEGPNEPALTRLAKGWDSERMDELLLLYPTAKARGFGPNGDFMLEADGRVWRKGSTLPRSHVFSSVQIVRPSLYDQIEKSYFSNNEIFDLAEERGRLYGLEHDGTLFHVGTPQDLEEANRLLASGEGWG